VLISEHKLRNMKTVFCIGLLFCLKAAIVFACGGVRWLLIKYNITSRCLHYGFDDLIILLYLTLAYLSCDLYSYKI